MALYKFSPSDIFYNQIKAHQKSEFFIYHGKVYYNKRGQISLKNKTLQNLVTNQRLVMTQQRLKHLNILRSLDRCMVK